MYLHHRECILVVILKDIRVLLFGIQILLLLVKNMRKRNKVLFLLKENQQEEMFERMFRHNLQV